jgi:hypothetical protein
MAVLLLTGIVSTATAGDQHRNENKAETKELPWRAELSGNFINTQSDTKHDGDKGSLQNGGIKSTLGSGTLQGVGEVALSGSGKCPNGHDGLIATLLPGTGHSFYRFDNTGDLLFVEFSETVCIDLTTGIQFVSGTENFTGGTGQFVGATGTDTWSGTATILYDDGAGNFFGEFTVTVAGAIIVPANVGHGKDN